MIDCARRMAIPACTYGNYSFVKGYIFYFIFKKIKESGANMFDNYVD